MTTVRELDAGELQTAAGVLGRGMRDNPLHVRAFGADPAHRERALARLFRPVLRQYLGKGAVLGAFQGIAMAGVCGMVQPRRCRPSILEKLQVLPAVVLGNPLSTTRALRRWTQVWAGHDPAQPHWHLGPVAVDRALQGQGIGSALVRGFCRTVDTGLSVAYLETDKLENVKFYERFGFTVIEEAVVLGVPNWFMLRPAALVS